MARKHKRPRVAREPSPSKTPRLIEPNNYLKEFPSWRFGAMDMKGEWGWGRVSGEKLAEIREKLTDFEGMTWNEILVSQRTRNHRVSIERICFQAQKRLTEIKLDDTSCIWSLRLSGKNRVWGILDGNVFLLLWWDPDHKVYPTEPKNT